MARVKTFVNGGTVLPGDLNSIEDDYECAFGTYKHIAWGNTQIGGSNPAGVFLATPSILTGTLLILDPALFWSDAATSGTNPRTVYYKLGMVILTSNTPAGAVTFTAGLYSVTGTSGSTPTVAASPVTGSTVSVNGSGLVANSVSSVVYSADFAAPTIGSYELCVATNATTAASSNTIPTIGLWARQV